MTPQAAERTPGTCVSSGMPPLGGSENGLRAPPSFVLRSIEVQRGPQGTLLGADTQGGAVRFVPNEPSLTAYTALAHAEWATTERGEPSYAWQRSDGGYVDRVDPFTHTMVDPNANRDTSESVRGVLTYAPNSTWTISPSINYVSSRAHDSPSFFT